jgi:polyhydroxybutyrate depolymerase
MTLISGGTERTFIRHVPPSYAASTPMPLVVDLHGYSEGAAIHTKLTALGPFGDTHGFITVAPQGSGAVARWDVSLGGADVAFIGDLLDHEEQQLCIDTRRVFATGMSNGAFMASAVACRYADRVAAIAPVAGLSDIDGCAPVRPVPVIAFHGTADQYVAYDGGYGSAVAGLPAPDGSGRTIGDLGALNGAGPPAIPANLARWASLDGCSAGDAPSQARVTDDVTRLAYACAPGVDVELYRVEGGGHTWPGSALSAAVESVIGRTTMSISANELLWSFFAAHPRQG